MILILAYWLFLLFLFLPYGVFITKSCKIHINSLPLIVILGMLLYTVISSILAFYIPLGTLTLYTGTGFSFLLTIVFRKDIFKILADLKQQLLTLQVTGKVILAALILAAALKSAQPPSLIDNESYYIQTIKWINEYGFVKGIGNLHPFLAQMSGWHVLHAEVGMNMFNDINGFMLVICLVFCLAEGNMQHYKLKWITIIPLFSPLYFLFLDSPSPDLPLMLLTSVIFYLLVNNNIRISWLLFLFMMLIKVTIAPLLLLFLHPIFRTRKDFIFMFVSGLLVLSVWIAKNIVVSGYPLYPLTVFPTTVDWLVPEHLLKGLHESSNASVYGVETTASIEQMFISWICKRGIDGLLNKVVVALLIITPFFRKIRYQKQYLAIYTISVVHFVILFMVSPQGRFYLPIVLFLASFVITELLNSIRYRKKMYTTAIIAGTLAIIITFPGLNRSQFYLHGHKSAFPDIYFRKITTGNLTYYSPKTNFFFYGTANGPLPCVNEEQLKWFKHKYNVVPQLRGSTIKNGFYCIVVDKE